MAPVRNHWPVFPKEATEGVRRDAAPWVTCHDTAPFVAADNIAVASNTPIGTQKLTLDVRNTTVGSTAIGKDDRLITIE